MTARCVSSTFGHAVQLRTEIEIEAPPEEVWLTLTEFSRYHEWNPFITSIEGVLEVGKRIRVSVSPPESNESRFEPTVLVHDPPFELRWRGHVLIKGLFDGEHFFQLSETPGGRTRFVHGEDFSGVLVRFFGRTLTQVARGFVYMNQALKRRVEGER
jgi:hypothetical protein